MKFNFSSYLDFMRPSEIRELAKYATSKDIISFGGGMPNPATFPKDRLKEIMVDVLDRDGDAALQYGNTAGLNSLREELVGFLKRTEGIDCAPEDIIITSGSQQALYAIGKLLCNPGDGVITEDPTYVGAISAFNANAIRMHGVPMDGQGVVVDVLEEKVRSLVSKGKAPRFIYLIPNFQNPTGRTLTEKRRQEVIRIASEYGIPVVEDNPYGELRYSGERVRSIRSLDGSVIYLGTFSKVMTPGLRLGYIVAPREVTEKVNLLKQALDLATNSFSQYVATEYIRRGIIYEQIRFNVELYRKRRDAMVRALREEMGDMADFSVPDGGMFIWVTLNNSVDTSRMLIDAIKAGVTYVSGQAFAPNGGHEHSMRLNFTFPSEEKIYEGVRRLRSVILSRAQEAVS